MSRLLLAALVSARRMARGRAANADLEGAIRDAYVDKHQVHHGSITVDGEAVEFLEAGPKDAAKTVLFCHGAAFSMTTWQHVGVLDALAGGGRGMRGLRLECVARDTARRRRRSAAGRARRGSCGASSVGAGPAVDSDDRGGVHGRARMRCRS